VRSWSWVSLTKKLEEKNCAFVIRRKIRIKSAGEKALLSREALILRVGAMSNLAPGNVPELSVSELSAALKRTIEDRFGFVRVRGEISNYRGPHSSGHVYFSLKDQSDRIDAVIWKGAFARLRTKPQEGLEVIATGKVTTYPGKSAYQIIIDTLEPAGIGALMALVEERRRKLAAEGLFGEANKRPIPFLPSCIGVVTSPTGAVIRDILHRVAERFPRQVIVWPVHVQGESSAVEIAAAIDGLNALPEHGSPPRPDVIIVARGGGSLEDLMSFNEEIVVRAVARSLVPLISAVGHETDWTLIDHAADLRAPTPTAAAEKAVPVRRELAVRLADLSRRQIEASLRGLERRRSEFRALMRALPQSDSILGLRRQQLDNLESRIIAGRAKAYHGWHLGLARLAHRLAQQSPHAKLGRAAERLNALQQRLLRWQAVGNDGRRRGLAHMTARLGNARSTRVRAAAERARGLAHRLKQQSPEPRLRRMTEALQAVQKQLQHCLIRQWQRRRQMLDYLTGRLAVAGAGRAQLEGERLVAARQHLNYFERRMKNAFRSSIETRRQRIETLLKILGTLDYHKVLERGFALVRDENNNVFRKAAKIPEGAHLDIEFSDGHRTAVAGKPKNPAPAKRRPSKGRRKPEQGSLF
jgi:exodeoxyribonuclease VII large subunit